MQAIIGLLILAFAEAVVVVGPAYPPNAVAGGTVVAALKIAAGAVERIEILQADAPFAHPVQAALSGWRFTPGTEAALVVVNYRTANLYSVGSPSHSIKAAKTVGGLPYPRTVIEPPYPPNSLAEGSVVLRLAVDRNGSVARIRVLQGLGDFTSACAATVRQWRFAPAKNDKGTSIASEAYAVFTVRRPILAR